MRPPHSADGYAYFARQALADGFPLLAVFFARRHFSRRRTSAVFWQAANVLLRALAHAPTQAVSLLRMFGTGPLRTHGLRPL